MAINVDLVGVNGTKYFVPKHQKFVLSSHAEHNPESYLCCMVENRQIVAAIELNAYGKILGTVGDVNNIKQIKKHFSI